MIKLALLGFPATYSLSPFMFGAALQAEGLDGFYEALPTYPEELQSTIQRLRNEGYTGVNVTTPLKQIALRIAEASDGIVRCLDSTNLILFKPEGSMLAYNTDVDGVAEAMMETGRNLAGGNGLVLGAGGAARAAIFALGDRLKMKRVYISSLEDKEMQNWIEGMQEHLPNTELISFNWDARMQLITDVHFNVLINATTLGWKPDDEEPMPAELIPYDCFVLDLNYPHPNRWLRSLAAQAKFAKDGLRSLLYQGAAAFRIFTQLKPPVSTMWQALLDARRNNAAEKHV